ncbi:ankyrin repeat and MYND domain-containing protein 1 isoform X2 [Rhinatrema bivittatum]|uniref:ankyrin repeat and MYND domain-containing protein 1 isoform X2 n=1 Tax=Rhinatrema bivittatum TaxID=194408 RepID=UPI001127ABB0|nr:ankyrin repeat and MYND domain-containing protein 1 isoform X2 [Rhinatrema bivittatum]
MKIMQFEIFQGLYEADERFGPGIETHEDGSKDVGLWFGDHLIKLCTEVPGSFSLREYPEYAHFLDDSAPQMPLDDLITSETPTGTDPFMYNFKELLLNDSYTLPENIYLYSSNVEHLPLTSSLRKEFDSLFFQEDEHKIADEEEDVQYVINNQTPLMIKMQKHIHKHRHSQKRVKWDVASVLSGHRERFGPRGHREIFAEQLIQKAAEGDYDGVYEILRDNLAHPDVSDANGHTALIAAAANCQYDIINLLLDNGANVNKLNDEGLSALSVGFMHYFPKESFESDTAERSISKVRSDEEFPLTAQEVEMEVISDDEIIAAKQQLFKDADLHSDMDTSLSSKNLKINIDLSILGPTSLSAEKLTPKSEKILDFDSLEGKSRLSCRLDSFDSNQCIFDFDSKISKEQKSPDLFSHFSQLSHPSQISTDEGTENKITQLTAEQKEIWATIKLLLRRGADPNISDIPMHPLFFAVKTGDVETVKLLLEKGAAADIHLPSELGGLTPLHIAVALPGEEGVKITELLLHFAMDPNVRAADDGMTYPFDKAEIPGAVPGFPMKGSNATGEVLYNYYEKPDVVAEEGGRSPLHIACERVNENKYASDIVRLLLMHKANPNVLWSGHSPLSLAIASGNDLAVRELLKYGADPNLPLGRGIESALCSALNPDYEQNKNLKAKISLIDMLVEAGANPLMPISIGQDPKKVLGTATDYAYYKHFQDKKISQTPYHSLSPEERDLFNTRKQMLDHMGDVTRESVTKKEKEWLAREAVSDTEMKTEEMALDVQRERRGSTFKYCYGCGRSVGVQLSPCPHCKSVYTCSSFCRKKAWNEYHKNECSAFKDLLQSASKLLADKQESRLQLESGKDKLSTKAAPKGFGDEIEGSSVDNLRTKTKQKGISADDETERGSTGSRSTKGIKGKRSPEEGGKESASQKIKGTLSKEDYEQSGKESYSKKKGRLAKGETEEGKESYSKKMALKGTGKKEDGGSQEYLRKKTPKGAKREDEEDDKESRSKKVTSKSILEKDEAQGTSRESPAAKTGPKGMLKGDEEGGMLESRRKKGLAAKGETEGSGAGLSGKKMPLKGMFAKGEVEKGFRESHLKKTMAKGAIGKGEADRFAAGSPRRTMPGIMARAETSMGVHGTKRLLKGIMARGEMEGRGTGYLGTKVVKTEYYMMDNYSFI